MWTYFFELLILQTFSKSLNNVILEIVEISWGILLKMFFYRFLWKSGDLRLIFRLNPKVSPNFHVEIEENQPETFC